MHAAVQKKNLICVPFLLQSSFVVRLPSEQSREGRDHLAMKHMYSASTQRFVQAYKLVGTVKQHFRVKL